MLTVGRRRVSGVKRVAVTLAVLGIAFAVPSTTSALADYTWSGGSALGGGNWSDATDWASGSAPSGSVGTLTFPALTNAACTASPPQQSCYQSTNDVTGISADALVIDDGVDYHISGNSITLGAGGLTAAPSANDNRSGGQISLPIALSAPQTWSITGGSIGQELNIASQVVTGASNSLTINFSGDTFLGFESFQQPAGTCCGSDVEVGPVTVQGAGVVVLGGPSGAALNGSDGNPVTLEAGSGLFVTAEADSQVGPLTSHGARVQVGEGLSPAGGLTVNGSLTLDRATLIQLVGVKASSTTGQLFPQIHARDAVDLGKARLNLEVAGNSACPKLALGEVDTLITTTGSLTGTFQGLPDGSTLEVSCNSATTRPTVRINYTAHDVTATVVPTASKPVFGKTAGAKLVAGVVLIRRRGASRFTPLTGSALIPVGSTVDTRQGTVSITAADPAGHVHSGDYYQGEFKILQPTGQTRGNLIPGFGFAELNLTGGSFAGCPGTGAARAARSLSSRHHTVRHLWGNAHGHFRMRGRYVVSTVLGTRWLTADRCDGTQVHVVSGKVVVTDLVKQTTKVITAGQTYLARAPR